MVFTSSSVSSSSATLAPVLTRLWRAASAAFLCLALGLSACGGGGSGEATTHQQAAGTTTTSKPRDDPEVAGALDLFVQAAGRGDAETMWGLLSRQSRSLLGPTLAKFEQEYADGFEDGLGSFATTDYDVVLSQVTPSGWGIAAIAGDSNARRKERVRSVCRPGRAGGRWLAPRARRPDQARAALARRQDERVPA